MSKDDGFPLPLELALPLESVLVDVGIPLECRRTMVVQHRVLLVLIRSSMFIINFLEFYPHIFIVTFDG